MSEFYCKNGHLMLQRPRCQICGALVESMDGKSDRELEAEEHRKLDEDVEDYEMEEDDE